MSYEGREQHICANGHLFETDALYSFGDNKPICQHCKAVSVWENSIDDTNGESFGEILPAEFNKLLIKPAVYETCNLGHQHLVSEAVYRIPVEGELKQSMYVAGEYKLINEVFPTSLTKAG